MINANSEVRDTLSSMPKRELQSLAKVLGIKRFSNLNKSELISELEKHPNILRALNPGWWEKYHNHVYGTVTVAGLLIAIMAFPFDNFSVRPKVVQDLGKSSVSEQDYQNSLLACTQELRNNSLYFRALHNYLQTESTHLPIGSVSVGRTLKLFDSHYDKVTQFAYGEEKHVYQLALQLHSISSKFNELKSRDEFISWNQTFEMTVDDLTFLNGFLSWYVNEVAQLDLEPAQLYSLGRFGVSDVFAHDKIGNLHMQVFVHKNGTPMTKYSDYLGLID